MFKLFVIGVAGVITGAYFARAAGYREAVRACGVGPCPTPPWVDARLNSAQTTPFRHIL